MSAAPEPVQSLADKAPILSTTILTGTKKVAYMDAPFLSSTLSALVRRLKIAAIYPAYISELKSLALMECAG